MLERQKPYQWTFSVRFTNLMGFYFTKSLKNGFVIIFLVGLERCVQVGYLPFRIHDKDGPFRDKAFVIVDAVILSGLFCPV